MDVDKHVTGLDVACLLATERHHRPPSNQRDDEDVQLPRITTSFFPPGSAHGQSHAVAGPEQVVDDVGRGALRRRRPSREDQGPPGPTALSGGVVIDRHRGGRPLLARHGARRAREVARGRFENSDHASHAVKRGVHR